MIILIDGNNVLWRYVPMGYLRCGGYVVKDILNLVDEHNAEGVIVVWDGGNQKRKELFPEYKRRDKDPDIVKKGEILRDDIQDNLRLCGIPQVLVPEEEADDVIASFVRNIFDNDKVLISSTDKDFYSLLENDRVLLWNGKILRDEADFINEYSILPTEWTKLRSLSGDSSDNIPGIKGIGLKKGLKILEADTYDDYSEKEEVKISKQLLDFMPVSEDKIFDGIDFGSIDKFRMSQMIEIFKLGDSNIVEKCFNLYQKQRIKNWRCSFLENAMSNCSSCSMRESSNNVVCWKGDLDSKILFIGDAPGEEDDNSGDPFAGKAGGLLDEWVREIGLKTPDVLISNTVWCRPVKDGKNREPKDKEIAFCSKLGIERLIKYTQPELIVCLGKIPSKYVFGRKIKVTKESGLYKLNRFGYNFDAWILLNPASLLYPNNYKGLIYDQLREIKEYLLAKNLV